MRPKSRPRIFGLDLATTSGWCRLDVDTIRHGTFDCSIGNHELPGTRYLRLFDHLNRVALPYGVDIIFTEDIKRHEAHAARQVYFGLRAMLDVWVSMKSPRTKIRLLPIGKVKQYATGRGNAKKEEMLACLPKQFAAVTSLDESDAIWIMLYGWSLLK